MANNFFSPNNKSLWILVIALIVGLAVWGVLTMPDDRTMGQKIGDAVDELPNGVDNAARELEDRTPGERMGDAIEDAGENVGDTIRDNTDR